MDQFMWYFRRSTTISPSESVGQILPLIELGLNYYYFQLSVQVVPGAPEILCQMSQGDIACCNLMAPNDHFKWTCWLCNVVLRTEASIPIVSHLHTATVRSQSCDILQAPKEKVWKEIIVLLLPWMKYWIYVFMFNLNRGVCCQE